MRPEQVIEQLESNAQVFSNLFSNVGPELQTFVPSEGQWCLLEVICHLRDEEREDFRVRIDYMLRRPNERFPKFDPTQWPEQRNYLQEDFAAMVESFLEERHQSIHWLRSLCEADWDLQVDHERLGTVSPRFFLMNWLAHDYHHIRQINRLKYEFLKSRKGCDLRYAGKW